MIQKVAQSTGNVSQESLEPSPHQVDVFKQMMNPPTEPSAEQSMLSGIQETGKSISAALKSINLESAHQLTPEKLLSTQINVIQSVVEVELVAKTAGSASQSINKLTSMQ
ncbi:type III secretion system inner rod subunit SctI [Vibrio sp. S4M6]|uniref:type III secretion system inner rod subunit SctI n=1 Tax=Vibrio sinus TaxID=2946865 RepID=UPI00202A13B4|nr:type III secretion system inner rod subunit SctI [Vibrio sinus]MCL9783825.1 type III secretion system inner rod subunit SctI [Vibrio sinus]